MVGLLAYAAAGALEGYGVGLVGQAQAAREAAIEAARNAQRDRERADDRAYDTSVRNDGRAYDERMAADDRARTDATTARNANVYESLFGTESGGNFSAANSEGYNGRSQFGADRLADYSRATGTATITPEQFRSDPALQQAVEQWHFKDINKFIDDHDLAQYEGQTIDGVEVTRSGMIAMAHLGGSGGMQRFLTSNGEYNPADSNGTHLSDYAATHAGLSTDMADVWTTIADPNTPAPLRDAALGEVQRRNNGGIAAQVSLTGEEWVANGDGTETRMGVVDGTNSMQPYLGPDGQPVTRPVTPDDKPQVTVSRGLQTDLGRRFTSEITGEVDYDIVDPLVTEIERLMNSEGMTEQQAKADALSRMEYEQIVTPEDRGWGIGTPTPASTKNGAFLGTFRDRNATAPATTAPVTDPGTATTPDLTAITPQDVAKMTSAQITAMIGPLSDGELLQIPENVRAAMLARSSQ